MLRCALLLIWNKNPWNKGHFWQNGDYQLHRLIKIRHWPPGVIRVYIPISKHESWWKFKKTIGTWRAMKGAIRQPWGVCVYAIIEHTWKHGTAGMSTRVIGKIAEEKKQWSEEYRNHNQLTVCHQRSDIRRTHAPDHIPLALPSNTMATTS